MPHQSHRYLSGRQLPSGRRLRVLRQWSAIFPATPPHSERIAVAMAATQKERVLVDEWTRQRQRPVSRARKGQAAAIDPELDRIVSAIYKILDARLQLVTLASTEAEHLAALMAEAYPFGVSHIIRKNYEEQIALVFELIAVLDDAAHAAAVAEVQLGAAIAELKRLAEAFDAALSAESPRLAYAEVATARQAALEAYADVVIALLFESSGAAQRAQRRAWLAPHHQQMDDFAIWCARGRSTADVNPDTGEVVLDEEDEA